MLDPHSGAVTLSIMMPTLVQLVFSTCDGRSRNNTSCNWMLLHTVQGRHCSRACCRRCDPC